MQRKAKADLSPDSEKKLTKPFQPRTVAITSSRGKKLTEPDQVCHRWKEYCQELYNDDEENRHIDVQEKEPPPPKDEIRRALLKSTRLKASGSDGIAAELLRFGGEMTLNKLHEVCVELLTLVSRVERLWPDE